MLITPERGIMSSIKIRRKGGSFHLEAVLLKKLIILRGAIGAWRAFVNGQLDEVICCTRYAPNKNLPGKLQLEKVDHGGTCKT